MNLYRGQDVLIAQIESRVERKEYQKKGRCIRFTAIRIKDLSALADNNGVTTLNVDLSYWEFCRSTVGNRWLTEDVRQKIDSDQDNESSWYELKVHWNALPAHGYAYSTFSDEAPTNFSLITCKPIPNPLLNSTTSNISFITQVPAKKHVTSKVFGTGKKWTLWGFHVGQGMCSLLTDTLTYGVILDAGAGTPLIRPNYQNKAKRIRNDLIDKLNHLDFIDMILSHADSDHWRLLAWDSSLRKKINNIYVPSNAKSLVLKDKEMIKKVTEVETYRFNLSGGDSLDVFRSNPTRQDDNTNCLVSLYTSARYKQYALFSGDYVYRDMNNDKNPNISSLSTKHYCAIVVPHHGDAASSINVFKPSVPDTSIAFFSAGDHKYYGHPTLQSTEAHLNAQFKVIQDKNIAHIEAIQLIP